ncbi:MAG: prenyltransferase/squalene oxidase repeat-containing protein [Verrucomicrobiaceae bacterium]
MNPDPNQQPPAQPGAAPYPHPGATQPMPQGYPQMPPGYMPPPGYPPHMSGPMAMGGYPPGYPMPQGYPQMPPGYPQGYPQMPQGYPQMPPGYPAMPPGYPQMPGMMPPPTMPMPAVAPPPAPGATAPLTPAPTAAPKPAVPAPSSAAPATPVVAVPVPTVAAVPVATAVPDDAAHHHTEFGPVEVFHPEAAHHIEPAKPQNAFVKMWKKVGGGSLTFSIMVHAGILLAMFLIVVAKSVVEKQVDFLPGGGTQQGQQASQDLQHKVQQKKRSTISKTVPLKKIVTTSVNAEVSLPEAPPDALDIPDAASMLGGGSMGSGGFGGGGAGGGFGKGIGIGGANGFVSLPPSMRSRCSTQERLEKLRQNGGSPECEAAVSASLEWLKGKQNADGSWGRGNKAAMTGLALLCYLGRCETPESPFYGENVMKGIMYLIELSKKNPHGIISEGWMGEKGGAGTYEHGIATYALGEMYTLARLGSKSLPGMREAFEKGVKVIIDNQSPTGGWGYGGKEIVYNKATGNDLSVVGWQFQAVKAAKNTKLKIDGLESCIKKMLEYIENKQTKDGGFGGADRDKHYNQWSLTGVGILALETMAKNKSAATKKAVKFMHEFLAAEPLDWNKNCNLYCWYYYTQAFFQVGGEEWKFYNQMFLPQILSAQQPDGSFKRGRPNYPAGDAADEIYRQCLCTLQLESYYRYLKVGDREEQSFFDK